MLDKDVPFSNRASSFFFHFDTNMNSKMETLWETDLHKQNFHNKSCSRERSIMITHDESGPKKALTHYFIKQQSLWCYDQASRVENKTFQK